MGLSSVINIFLMLMPSRHQGKDSLFLNFYIIKHHAIHSKLPQYHWCKGTITQFSSVTQSCMTLCNPMDCSRPGFLVHHEFLEIAQTHVHPVGDAIQPSHPLSSPSPAFNLSQQQGLFQWVSSLKGGQSIGVSSSASVLPVNIQGWFPLGLTDWMTL